MMESVLAKIVKNILLPLSPAAALLIVLLFFPEKIEKLSSLVWRLLSRIGILFRFAHKRYVKHDLQGRVNDFVRRLRRLIPGSFNDKLELEWVDPNTKRASLIADGRIVLRLRSNDPQDHNFVHAAYLYVSTCLLKKTKRYLSPPQCEAIDLFVATKMIQEEKPVVLGFFLDEYLHPKTDNTKTKVAVLIDDFAIIDKAGFFFPLFIQELEYLGEKVFGRKKDSAIIGEINDVIDFLRPVSQRKIGEETDLNYGGNYCRFGIVIIGKPAKLIVSLDPYIKYIEKNIVNKQFDTIYILGRPENKKKIDAICGAFNTQYAHARSFVSSRVLRYEDQEIISPQYLVILRRIGVEVISPSNKGT